MYNKVDYNIKQFEYDDINTENAWKDIALDDTIECVDSFQNKDWEELVKELPSKSQVWEKRLCDCLNDYNNPIQKTVLIYMTTLAEDDLFKYIINNLVDFDINEVKGADIVYDRAKKMLPTVDEPERIIFNQFLEKKTKVR